MKPDERRGKPTPLSPSRRLKSLDEFRRPWGFPTFVPPERKEARVSSALVACVGLALGAALGLLVF